MLHRFAEVCTVMNKYVDNVLLTNAHLVVIVDTECVYLFDSVF